MYDLLSAFSGVWQTLQTLGLLTPEKATCGADNPVGTAAAATAQPATAAGPGHAAAERIGQARSCSSGSGSSSQPVFWQYLLRLHESRKLATAAAPFSARWSQDVVHSVLSRYKQLLDAEKAAIAA
jgi:hypothetical protein